MKDYKEAILELAKECSVEFVTTSRVITSRPCFVFACVISPEDADNKSEVYLRNGETALSEKLLSFKVRYSHPVHAACPPVHFNKGLYVQLQDNSDGITIQYLEE